MSEIDPSNRSSGRTHTPDDIPVETKKHESFWQRTLHRLGAAGVRETQMFEEYTSGAMTLPAGTYVNVSAQSPATVEEVRYNQQVQRIIYTSKFKEAQANLMRRIGNPEWRASLNEEGNPSS